MSFQHQIKLPDGVDILEMDVAISNALTRSDQDLTLTEKRLITCAIARMGRQKWPRGYTDVPRDFNAEIWDDWTKLPNSPFTVRVSVDDYSTAAQVDKSTAYTQLKQAAAALYERSIKADVKTAQGIKTTEFRWVQSVEYMEGQGWVELAWSAKVAEHLYNLTGKFTLYKLRQMSHLSNIYAIRLFELFASYSPEKYLVKGRYHPTMDEFNHSMRVPEAYLKDFAGIRRRVIDKAVAELTANLGLQITWTTKNRGRKIIGLDFVFGPPPPPPGFQDVLDEDTAPSPDTDTLPLFQTMTGPRAPFGHCD